MCKHTATTCSYREFQIISTTGARGKQYICMGTAQARGILAAIRSTEIYNRAPFPLTHISLETGRGLHRFVKVQADTIGCNSYQEPDHYNTIAEHEESRVRPPLLDTKVRSTTIPCAYNFEEVQVPLYPTMHACMHAKSHHVC